MPILTITHTPNPLVAGLLGEAQLCYVLVRISAAGDGAARPVNWALVADASRSMRIPIVDEAQFRALIREGGAQETLVDGVPVWQLSGPVPPDVRAASRSALDHVARALHSVVERLDAHDRFALIACAEEAVLLARSASGAQRAELARGIARLPSLNLGEQTDLARGIELALNELRHGRDSQRVERLLLLTDGFTQRPDACLALAKAAAAEGVAISTIGLGGEFQEEVLTELADRSGGRALFLHKPEEIPRTVAAELDMARAAAARAISLRVAPAAATVRRITRIRPDLATLYEGVTGEMPPDLPLGDVAGGAQITLLLELLAPAAAQPTTAVPLAQLAVTSAGALVAQVELHVDYQTVAPPHPREVLDAAARAAAARLQRRAVATATGNPAEAARLLRAAATRLDDLGEHALAGAARAQAHTLELGGAANPLATKELTYATRRLGGE
ncbi:MAG TPA: VWA domain-containing protein [Roseiflexaceae bacterium]|nr:VWA domain-containing protein [Roseiflexaceae bacterium]